MGDVEGEYRCTKKKSKAATLASEAEDGGAAPVARRDEHGAAGDRRGRGRSAPRPGTSASRPRWPPRRRRRPARTRRRETRPQGKCSARLGRGGFRAPAEGSAGSACAADATGYPAARSMPCPTTWRRPPGRRGACSRSGPDCRGQRLAAADAAPARVAPRARAAATRRSTPGGRAWHRARAGYPVASAAHAEPALPSAGARNPPRPSLALHLPCGRVSASPRTRGPSPSSRGPPRSAG